MKALSEHVIGTTATIACHAFTRGQLNIEFLTAGLDRFVPADPYAKTDLVSATTQAAVRSAHGGDDNAAEGLHRFVKAVVERVAAADNATTEGSPFWQLREALRGDGYDIHRELEAVDPDAWPPRTPRVTAIRFLPLDDPTAPMTEAITALEADLERLGLDVAASHYRQAVEALTDGRHESANGQVRALLEEVVVRAAVTVGFQRTKQGDGGQAIRYLINCRHLDPAADADYIRGLWGMTHTNGPHPGTTTAGEARFRLQAITSAVHYLLDKFFDA